MQPVIIEDIIAIAANTINDNVIVSNPSLRRYLRAPFPARGKLLATQSAAGLVIDFDYGSKNVVASSNPRVVAGINDPENLLSDMWWCNEGDQLVLRASNPTAGALSLRYRIVLEPAEQLLPDSRIITRGPIAIAAGAVDFQLLDGLRYERPPVDCMMDAYIIGSATGLTRTINIDTENISPPAAVNPINVIPREPFDITIHDVEVPADKLIEFAISNPTAGALNAFWKMRLQELVRS